MKIRLSLRLYVLGTLLFLISSLAAVYSVLTVQYFIQGLDAITQRTMVEVANSVALDEAGHAQLLGFHVTNSVDNIPDDILQHIPTAPQAPFEFKKKILQSSLFTRPDGAYFLMLVETMDNEQRYVSRALTEEMPRIMPPPMRINPITGSILMAVTVILVFVLLLFFIMRSVANPVENLRHWARSLTPERLRQPAPDFRYSELNSLADLVRNSLLSVQQALEREHDFLRHASHELRTPIATVRSNIELLKKINPTPSEKEGKVIDRIERASSTMSHLTETLLWLSRDVDGPLPEEPVELNTLVEQISHDLAYLLQGKSVFVHTQTSPMVIPLPRIAAQIMLANLIRNAFQHTQNGEVWIDQKGELVTIINRNQSAETDETNELGFGLGLDLTRKLAERFDWHYQNQSTPCGHEVVLRFIASKTVD
ncbi:sensor histidine kinase [Hahella ganghwensis]|uniref:sensor histidine kinase n=1 Tax=Hahella ganghwensis TaxID=286420 RepID=UPI0003686E67|nr:HAMP domain-containing sensor histidine kinase [Hahella ganghwensis]